MATTITIVAVTRRGTAHETNEDAIGIDGTVIWGPDAAHFPPVPIATTTTIRTPMTIAVADGVSGTVGARDAAVLVAAGLSTLGRYDSEADLRSRANGVHRQVAADRTNGLVADRGSTGAAIVVHPHGGVTLLHVGDSRIYYPRAQSFVHSSDDVAALPMSTRTALSQWFGMSDRDSVDLHVDALEPTYGRRMLLCTDGLASRLGDQRIEEVALRADLSGRILRPAEVALADLIPPGEPLGPDDETAVLVDIISTEDDRRRSMPAERVTLLRPLR